MAKIPSFLRNLGTALAAPFRAVRSFFVGPKTKPKRPKIPERTRRLTKDELAYLGLSPGSKRRVNADLKRITKRTPTFTDRQWAEHKAGETKEAHAVTKRTTAYPLQNSRHIEGINQRQFHKQLKAARGKKVNIAFEGQPVRAGARYQTGADTWSTSERLDADELLENPAFFERVKQRLGFTEDVKVKSFGIYIYDGPPAVSPSKKRTTREFRRKGR